MLYRYTRSISLVLLLLCAAAPLPAIGELLGTEETAPVERSIPNPAELQPLWHEYFTAESEELAQRIAAFDAVLKEQLAELSSDDRAIAKPLIEKINVNLRVLAQLRTHDTPAPPPPISIEASYVPAKLVEVHRALEDAMRDARQQQEDLDELNNLIRSASHHLDNIFAAYLEIGEATSARYLQGLEIIAKWSSLGIHREEQRIQQVRVENSAFLASQYTTELEKAAERLVPTQDADELDSARVRLEKARAIAEQRQVTAESNLLGPQPDTPLGDATKDHLGQQAVFASAAAALAAAEEQLITMLIDLNILLGSDEPENIESFSDRLKVWEEEREELKDQLKVWHTSSTREYDRAFEGYLETGDVDAPEPKQLARRHQLRMQTAQETLALLQQLDERLDEVTYLSSVLDEEILTRWSQLGQWGVAVGDVAEDFWSVTGSWLITSLFKIGGTPVTLLGMFRSLIIILIGWWLSRFVQSTLQRMGDQQKRIAGSTFYTLARLAHYAILGMALVIALASLGLDFSNLALVAGALSLGIGFGLQSIVSNFLSGLIILFEQNVKVGDFIELESGYRGRITSINVRSTVIRTNDGIEVLIPNSEIIGFKTVNWTMSDAFRRIHIPFGVAYRSDKEVVKKAVLEAAERVPHTVKGVARYRDPAVWLVGFGDNALNFELIVWVSAPASKSVTRTTADYLWEIHTSLLQYDIEIPFPQRDLYLKEYPAKEEPPATPVEL